MRPPPLRLTDETLEEALAAMQAQGEKFGFVVGEKGYRGVVTRDAVSAAIASRTGPGIADIAIAAATIEPGASLAEALPATLASEFPLAVVDAEGDLAGILPADRVGEILTPPEEKVAAE
jgi:glycine betaine/proline transport system ATP-binding protein